jgi:uncharacterized membrane protein
VTAHSARDPRPALVEAVARLEAASGLDRPVDALEPAAHALVRDPRLRGLLQGDVLGHALHPVMTDVPIGAWLSAAVLDLTGVPGSAPAARRLIGVGLLTAAPTAVTGLAEWAAAGRAAKRVGVVHAALNTVALTLYTVSWLARRGGGEGAGRVSGLLGLSAVMASGFLGGHLAIARKVGSHDPAFD